MNHLESLLAAAAQSYAKLDARMQLAQAAYDRMNRLAHERVWTGELKVSGIGKEAFQPGQVAAEDVEVRSSPVVDRHLVTTRARGAGDELVREGPFVLLPWNLLDSEARDDWLEVWRELSSGQVEALEEFEANMETASAEDAEKFRLTEEEVAEIESAGRACEASSLLLFRQVCRVNAQRFGFGAGLFTTASKLAHSCRPNCRVFEDGSTLAVRSLRELRPGEMLTISYIADEPLLLRDTESRQRYLYQKHCFRCACDRCRSPDLARQLACQACGQELHCDELHAEREASANLVCQCTSCGAKASLSWLRSAERSAVAAWRRLEMSLGDLAPKLLTPEVFVSAWESDGWHDWSEVWRGLGIWRQEHGMVLSWRHWTRAHAGLLASNMSILRARQGFPLPMSLAAVAREATRFLEVARALCPEAAWLTVEIEKDFATLLPGFRSELDAEVEAAALAEALGSLGRNEVLGGLDELD